MSDQQQHGPADSLEGADVVLDIGGDVGALIVHTDPAMHLVEIEISPNDESGEDVFQAEHPHEPEPHTHDDHSHDDHAHDDHTHDDGHTHTHGGHTHAHTPGTTHVAVHERRVAGQVRYAAIYPGLREGSYTLWNADHTPADTVEIVGGAVVELDWRGRPS